MDLYIVETPLQLLNALELRQREPGRTADLIMFRCSSWPDAAFDGLVDAGYWKRILHVPMPAYSDEQKGSSFFSRHAHTWKTYRSRREFENAIANVGPIDRLVIGTLFKGYMCHAIPRVSAKSLWMLDDGTDTLRFAEARRRGFPSPSLEWSGGILARLKRWVRVCWIDFEIVRPPAINFFTCYDLCATADDHIEHNDYRWMRSQLAGSQAIDDRVWFVGQPLSQDGYMTTDQYCSLVARVTAKYGSDRLVYLPHKRESAATLQVLSRTLGLEIRYYDQPLELVLALGPVRPKLLASFFSSALENCRLIFGEQLEIVAIEVPKDCLNAIRNDVAPYYEYFRSRGCATFRVEPLQFTKSAVGQDYAG